MPINGARTILRRDESPEARLSATTRREAAAAQSPGVEARSGVRLQPTGLPGDTADLTMIADERPDKVAERRVGSVPSGANLDPRQQGPICRRMLTGTAS